MNSFALLWGKILRSSIWVQESKETRLIWITLLALKDSEGIVQSSMIGLADQAKVTPDECKAALDVLLAPDPNDSSGVAEGRRIKVVQGGWQIVNHDLYRFSTEAKRAFWKAEKAAQRDRINKKKPKQPKRTRDRDGGEAAHIRMEEAGASEAQLDHHLEEHLPESAKVEAPEPEPLDEAEFRKQLREMGLSEPEIEAQVLAASEPEII